MYFRIDKDLRQISVPNHKRVIGAVSDDSVNTLRFVMPRIYEGVDLLTFKIKVFYVNAKNEGDTAIAENVRHKDGSIYFDWKIGRHAFVENGKVVFSVNLRKYADDETTVIQEFNTTICGVDVLRDIAEDTAVVTRYSDIVNQLISGWEDRFEEVQEAAEEATKGAENVNATISGTILTVTDRNGNTTSVNVKGDKGDKGDTGETAKFTLVNTKTLTATASTLNFNTTDSGDAWLFNEIYICIFTPVASATASGTFSMWFDDGSSITTSSISSVVRNSLQRRSYGIEDVGGICRFFATAGTSPNMYGMYNMFSTPVVWPSKKVQTLKISISSGEFPINTKVEIYAR